MKSVILLRRRRVLWGTVIAASLLSGFILTTRSANLLWRSAAVSHVAQSNPAASLNPPTRIPNLGSAPAAQPRLVEAYGKLPLSFELNQGQTDKRVKFISRGQGYILFLTGAEAVMALAGSLGRKKLVATGAGTFPVTGALFVTLLIGTILLVGALTFLPALTLTPILEHFLMLNGKLF